MRLPVVVASLVFVPAVFVLMDDIGRLSWRFFGRFVGASDEADATPAAASASAPKPQAGE